MSKSKAHIRIFESTDCDAGAFTHLNRLIFKDLLSQFVHA